MINGITPVLEAIEACPDRKALIFPGEAVLTFAELKQESLAFQSGLKHLGLSSGDTVLFAEGLSPQLYGFVLAALGLGVSVAVVEPWMPLSKINSVVKGLAPRLFLAGILGRVWGLRSEAIRAIPNWSSLSGVAAKATDAARELQVQTVSPDHLGLVAFTSGTTGAPKGVARRHGYLLEQHRVLGEALHHDQFQGPELTIFTNFVFANLASHRGSVVVPAQMNGDWSQRTLDWASRLQGPDAPVSATMGPAFLRRVMTHTGFSALRSVHVGGALTDNAIFRSAFGRWPEVEFGHIYGSSESEPVAVMDAREAVQLSESRGLFQTLALGRQVSAIESDFQKESLWVTGPHVCPLYIGENVAAENRLNKRVDERGRVWHRMGDRIELNGGVLWYRGRSGQTIADFDLEQELYEVCGSSKLFTERNKLGELEIYVEGDARVKMVREWVNQAQAEGRCLESVALLTTVIRRDRRHRARIDRVASRAKAKMNGRLELKK